jgi:hypothetical protein
MSGEYEFEVEFDIDTSGSGDTVLFRIFCSATDSTGFLPGGVVDISPNFIAVGEKKTIRWKTRVLNITQPNYAISFNLFFDNYTGDGEHTISNGGIKVKPKTVKFQPDMQLILKAWVNCEYQFDKLLSGVIHLIQGRLISDESTRTVWLLHPDKLTLQSGEQPEPFFNGQTANAEYDCTSTKETYRRLVENRYLQIGFKAPDDDWVKSQNYDGDNPIFAKKLDFGDKYEEATSNNYNPFFEASDNYLSKDLQAVYTPNIECAVNIPACWDNSDHKESTKLTPRILYALGYVSQYRGKTSGGVDVVANWKFKGITETLIPYAYQVSNESIGTDETAEVPEIHLIYGDRTNDVTSQFWELFILELIANLEIDFQLIINPIEFDQLNFRRWLNVLIGNKHYVGRLTEITDYTGTKADVTFRPVPLNTDACDVVYNCNNDPNFEATLNDSCLIVERLAGITSQISTDVVSWRRVGGSWTVYSAPVCGCDVREYLDFTYLCSGSDFTITDNSDCTDYLGSVTLYNSLNQAVDFWGVVTSSLVIPVSTLVSLGTSYIVATRATPIGTLSKAIKVIAFGSSCSSILVFIDSDRTNQLIYYPLEVRREVTFSDGCPAVIKSKFV